MTTTSLQIASGCDGVTFPVRVTPRAKRNAVAGVISGALKAYVTAPPEGGRANDAVIDLLADWLHIKRRQIEIVTGETTRNKVVRVLGVSREAIETKLVN